MGQREVVEIAERVLRAREEMIEAEARTSAYAAIAAEALFGSEDARRSLDGYTVACDQLVRARVVYASALGDYFAESERTAGRDPHRAPSADERDAFEGSAFEPSSRGEGAIAGLVLT